jgi:hypothetical protein
MIVKFSNCRPACKSTFRDIESDFSKIMGDITEDPTER